CICNPNFKYIIKRSTMKHLLLTITLCITSNTMILAQLSVAPNASNSTDTYIYASNVQIYVEDYIRLVENSAGTTEASIYLRDQAQLLQGGSDNQNRGSGFISVYQDSNSDAYDYNLWSSPVTKAVSGGANAGNRQYGMTNFHEATGITESSPATLTAGFNGISSPLQISYRWLYRWKNNTQEFIPIYGSTVVSPGKGFIMKGTDVTTAGIPETQNQNYDFRGRPHSGDISITLREDGTNFGGNPYPSALDLNAFFYDVDNVGKFTMIQYYDEDRTINSHLYLDNKAGYGTWAPGAESTIAPGEPGYNPGNYTVPVFQNFANDGTPLGGDNGNGDHIERRMAPIAQGFFIPSSPAVVGSDVLTFKNSHRVFVQESATFSEFRNSENFDGASGQNQIDPTEPQSQYFAPQLRINTYMGDSHMRQTLLILHDDTTDLFDLGWDAVSPLDATSEMYFPILVDDWDKFTPYPFVINAVPFDDILKQIPFTIDLDEKQNVVITGVEEIDLPIDHVYVYDALENTYQSIVAGNTASYVLDEGIHEDRFSIVFRKEFAINQEFIRESNDEASDLITMFQNNALTQLEVANPEGYEIAKAAIFDMRGRLVLHETNLGDNSKLTFPTGTFSDGVYLVLLTTSENLNIDYKIIVKN
ncbi:MAG: hypothetical protein ACI849_001685, partial [Patiriisocius sp.]